MDEDRPKYTFRDWARVEKKKNEQGLDSLTDEEREILRLGEEFADRMIARLPPGYLERVRSAMSTYGRIKEAYEALPPEDRMRYGEWSVQHLEVFLPLIVERTQPDED